MSTLVWYAPEDRPLDLAKLNAGDYDLVCSLHRQIARGDKVLLCQQAEVGDDERAEMFVRLKAGRYSAVHFSGSDCTQNHVIARESDEHRRQKDYWHRAGEDAGYRVFQEFRTGAGTILDVAIDGPRHTGIEVQHSALEERAAKARTTRSFGAGWLPIWFLDSDHTPPWFYKVPTLGCNPMPWSSLPPRRSATVRGPSRFIALTCTASNFGTCPASSKKRPKRPCGKRHPKREPWIGLTVDDLAALVPAGQIVPMRDLRADVHLVAPDSLSLFQELTGLSGEYLPGTNSRLRGSAAMLSTICVNPIHDRDDTSPLRSCAKCGKLPVGSGGILCQSCRAFIESRSIDDYYGARSC